MYMAGMTLLDLTLWLAVAALYLGFACVLGVLVRQARAAGDRWLIALSLVHAILVVTPASVLVLNWSAWPTAVGVGLLIAGVAAAWIGLERPAWVPASWWQQAFAQRYFGIAMTVAALWSLVWIWRQPALGPSIVAGAALAAALTSFARTPQPA
jgi:hypothetical protein